MNITTAPTTTQSQKLHTVKSASCLSENSESEASSSFSEKNFNSSRRSSLASCKLECSILDQIKNSYGSSEKIPRKGAFLVDTTRQPAEMLEASKSLLEIRNSDIQNNNLQNIPKIQVVNYNKHFENMDPRIKQHTMKSSPPENIVSAKVSTKRVGRFRITRIDEMHISQRKSEITHPIGNDKMARVVQLKDNISIIN